MKEEPLAGSQSGQCLVEHAKDPFIPAFDRGSTPAGAGTVESSLKVNHDFLSIGVEQRPRAWLMDSWEQPCGI